MDESVRLKKSWARIEHWLKENFPESLDNLYPPATKNRISIIEKTIGIPLPPAFIALLLIHNGEKIRWPPGVFPDGQRLMSVEEILDTWQTLEQIYGKQQNLDDSEAYWRALVDDRAIRIDGPVKPLYGSAKWIPISTANCKTVHFLDYDPPQGGTRGQVIAANPDQGVYRVLAPSFIRYMENYAMDLAVNKYTVQGDFIVISNAKTDMAKPDKVVPAFLKDVAYQNYNPAEASDHPHVADLEMGEEVLILGKMTSLMGEDEILFSILTERDKEYTFLAKPAFTKGHGTIAIDQYARVKARKFYGEIKSHFIEQGLANKPDFVAVQYTMLRTPRPTQRRGGLPSGSREHIIEKLAQNILDSVQLSYKDHHQYKEVTLDQLDALRAKFFHHHTTRLLKLGFDYICDLNDHSRHNTKASPLFRVMSCDDGVVASFYHLEPRLPALLMRWSNRALSRVMQLETEFSDGHIIISTTAAAENSASPLPDAITQYRHPAEISVEGLLHKHRMKIKRYQIQHPEVTIVQIRKTDEFFALRNRQYKMIYDHIRTLGWVTQEYLATQIKNRKVAMQVYDKIKQLQRN